MAHARVLLRRGEQEVIATLYHATGVLLTPDEAALSESCVDQVGPQGGRAHQRPASRATRFAQPSPQPHLSPPARRKLDACHHRGHCRGQGPGPSSSASARHKAACASRRCRIIGGRSWRTGTGACTLSTIDGSRDSPSLRAPPTTKPPASICTSRRGSGRSRTTVMHRACRRARRAHLCVRLCGDKSRHYCRP